MTSPATIALDPLVLEEMIRRVVREELTRFRETAPSSILDDWSQEEPEDEEGDQQLLAAALVEWEQYGHQPDTWVPWDTLKAG